jgi:hypothetical protein
MQRIAGPDFRSALRRYASPAVSAGWARPTRLVSGLVLFVYVATHLANHALGLVSLEVMEAGRLGFLALWRSPVPSVSATSP